MLLLPQRNINPIVVHLEKITWSVFGTLTWDNDSATVFSPSTEQRHAKDVHWLVFKTASLLKLQSRNVAYYGKTEWGVTMRGHYNFLIARQGTEKVAPDVLAATMQEIWSTQRRRAQVVPFDANRQQAGVRYQSKLEYVNGEQICPAEIISRALTVMLKNNADAVFAPLLPPLPNQIPAESFAG